MQIQDLANHQIGVEVARNDLDTELRETGFEEFLTAYGVDTSLGRLAVARSFIYSSNTATTDTVFDPLATRLETIHEVGISIDDRRRRLYRGISIASALHGEPAEPTHVEPKLDYVQFAVAQACITKLLMARNQYPYITKSLLKLDPFGD